MPPPPKIDSPTYKNYTTRAKACLVSVKTSTCYQDQVLMIFIDPGSYEGDFRL